jgi:two-component system, response regulator, stage 0 sporulation protein F
MSSESNRYILLVDDHDDSRELLSEFLTFSGFAIESRGSGEEALACLQTRGAPEAVITDLSLGSMSGVDLAKKIRANTNPSLPMIAVTGHADYRDAEGVFAHVLVKPVSLDRLKDVLTQSLSAA